MRDQATRLREIAEQYCERSSAKPHIITVTSGKGGVGKSTVALNLAVWLAALGNTTICFDADDNLGKLDVMAGVSPVLRLGDVLKGETDIDTALVPVQENLFLLAGDSGASNLPRVTVANQQELLERMADLERPCDYVVIDTAAGIGEEVIGFAVRAHETIVVTIPEPTAVMDAYAIVKMISRADEAVPVHVVVNAASSAAEADDTAAKLRMAVSTFLGRQIHYLGWIPRDPHVSKAIVHQVPLVREFPLAGASLSLQLIAERLINRSVPSRVRRVQIA